MTRVAGYFAVSIEGQVGYSYRIDATDSLTSGQWKALATIPMTQSPDLYIDPDSIGKPQRFYRAVVLQ
jgi:hypothetical protein